MCAFSLKNDTAPTILMNHAIDELLFSDIPDRASSPSRQHHTKNKKPPKTEKNMKQTNKPHILLLYKTMIPSVRLCGHCQLEYLAARGEVEYRPRTVMQVSHNDLNWADIVLLCRLDNAYEVRLARMLSQAHKYLIYVIDDDLLHVPAGLTSGAYYQQKSTKASIEQLLSLSDAVLSPSPVLLAKYAVDGRRGILLEEPAIDPLPYRPRDPGAPVKIGFAGSVDRTGDIEQILREALLRIHSEYGRKVSFVFFGAVPAFAQALNAQCVPYCDSYDAYRRTLNDLQLDIGLAPMPDTPFHACKHYNKFVEYSAAGIVGIFSDVKPYDRLAKQFDWRLLCRNTAGEWYNAIRRLVDNPALLDECKRRAAELTSDAFSVPVIARALGGTLAVLPLSPRQDCKNAVFLPLIKLTVPLGRLFSGLKRYGLKTPVIILRKIKAALGR